MHYWEKYFRAKRESSSRVLRKPHSKRLRNLCSSLNTGAVQLKMITWPGHVVYIREIANTHTYRNLVRKPDVKKLCEKLVHRKDDDVTMVFMK
jgi:hypothetical protein